MPNYGYGPEAQKRTKRLLEALLAYANGELEDCDHLNIEVNWQSEKQLLVRTEVRFLVELTAKEDKKVPPDSPDNPIPPIAGIDGWQVCHDMLEAQNQGDNETAFAALAQLIESTDESTRRRAAYNLKEIGTDNETAFAALVQLIESTENESNL